MKHVRDRIAARLEGKGWKRIAAPTPTPAPRVHRVPNAPVGEVLEWVGTDPGRAKAALEAEERKPKPRTSLIDKLKRL